jgi:hypothetical protein
MPFLVDRLLLSTITFGASAIRSVPRKFEGNGRLNRIHSCSSTSTMPSARTWGLMHLSRAVLEHGQAWERIEQAVGRMAADCRDRYRNHLSEKGRNSGKRTIGQCTGLGTGFNSFLSQAFGRRKKRMSSWQLFRRCRHAAKNRTRKFSGAVLASAWAESVGSSNVASSGASLWITVVSDI